MRDLKDIQSDNRRAAVNHKSLQLYYQLAELVAKAKLANWPEAQYAKAEALVVSIEHEATGRSLAAGVPTDFRAPE